MYTRLTLAFLLLIPTSALAGLVHIGDICQLALLSERPKHTTSITRRNTEDAFNRFWNLQHKILKFDSEILPGAEPVSGHSFGGVASKDSLAIAQRTEGLARRYLAPDVTAELAVGSVVYGYDNILAHLSKYREKLARLSAAQEDALLKQREIEINAAMIGFGVPILSSHFGNLSNYSIEHLSSIERMEKKLQEGLLPDEYVFDSITGTLDREFIKRFWATGFAGDSPGEWRNNSVNSLWQWLTGGPPAAWVLVDYVLMLDEEYDPPEPVFATFIRTSVDKPKYPPPPKRKKQNVTEANPIVIPGWTPEPVPIPIPIPIRPRDPRGPR